MLTSIEDVEIVEPAKFCCFLLLPNLIILIFVIFIFVIIFIILKDGRSKKSVNVNQSYCFFKDMTFDFDNVQK